ncbi:MAG TPA: SpoIIE family protein phosphatase, partial [Spirochaetia bacterium]|nr:SpoIIE family protein phosphatase [Spirochaetia bacterium]
EDGGRTWGKARLITDFSEKVDNQEIAAFRFDNQRPFLVAANDRLALAWQRSFGRGNPQIYYVELSPTGERIGDAEQVSEGNYSCNSPRLIYFKGSTYVLWFDNRKGDDHIFLAQKQGAFWRSSDVSLMSGNSIFGEFYSNGDDLFVAWRNELRNTSRLVFLMPDKTVDAPVISPVNFVEGRKARLNRFEVRWSLPSDSSGIAGFSYTVSREPNAIPAQKLMTLREDRRAFIDTDEDGTWYFHVSAQDYAGNWSKPSTVSFIRDTTPPPPVIFVEPQTDEKGFLLSNTGAVEWLSPEDPDLAGYSYSLDLVSERLVLSEVPVSLSLPQQLDRVLSRDARYQFRNLDNGIWRLTVTAIDSVGNVSEPRSIILAMNKYIPVTYITDISARRDELGRVTMRIVGRGFSEGGFVSEVILDRDGKEPYDYRFPRSSGVFTVSNDRLIENFSVEDIDKGNYRVGLVHPTRGIVFTSNTLSFEVSGTVKFGDFSAERRLSVRPIRPGLFNLPFNTLVVILLAAFGCLLVVVSINRIGSLIYEAQMLRTEAKALISGEPLTRAAKEQRIKKMKKQGLGLRVKFALLVTMLVLGVVVMVSIPLSSFMIETESRNLAEGLKQSTTVLLESLAAGSTTYLPSQNTLELGLLPAQISAMPDARYVTITSSGINDPERYDYIWATNDPDIASKIPDKEVNAGFTPITDPLTELTDTFRDTINTEARAAVSQLSEELKRIQSEAAVVALRLSVRRNEEDQKLLSSLQDEIAKLDKVINEKLTAIASRVGSIPEFNVSALDMNQTSYMFYRPIVYRSSQDDVYFRGFVRLGISTERIIRNIEEARASLLRRSLYIALAAIALGIVGALLLATIIIRPIKKLEKFVQTIRDTENKKDLKNLVVKINTRDEIAILADTIDEMRNGLVKAAIANEDLIIGKEVQKMFIPLEKDTLGNKLSTGSEENDAISFFGYYEGAKGVSGDYFDFRKVDDDHYAVIKCDVSGKGVSASLIMVEVATIFLDYFRNWTINAEKRKALAASEKGRVLPKPQIDISELVYRMNDLIEERGFTGRFAALVVLLLDMHTGECYVCHAGDKFLHLYREEKKAIEVINLPDAPTAGTFASFLVDTKGGFRQVKINLKRGDTLFLYTDGIEEAQRSFRDSSFRKITCNEPGLKAGDLHDTHPFGNETEELGTERIHAIIEAVLSKSTYRLFKYHNPIPNEELTFDFSSCEGTAGDAVIALAAVEKVFRMNPDPAAGEKDKVLVDRKIDDFLKKHFLQFGVYYSHPAESSGEYQVYTHLKEDEQYDDLTILGIRKK